MEVNKEIEEIKERESSTQEFLTALGNYVDNNFIVPSLEAQYTLDEWKRLFYVDIPEVIDFPILVFLAGEVARKYQQASAFRDKQQIQLAILEQNRVDKYNSAYNTTRRVSEEKHKKPLAAESCKVAALLEVREIDEALNTQKVIKDFWDSTCKTLTEVRKTLETIGFALSGDARINRDYVVKGKD